MEVPLELLVRRGSCESRKDQAAYSRAHSMAGLGSVITNI